MANTLRGAFALSLNKHYAADLTKYLEIVSELNNSLMMPNRRATLETCKQALEIMLAMYELPPNC